MGSTAARTILAFHRNAKLYKLETIVSSVVPFAALEEANQALFKQGTEEDHIVVTDRTIFHPQGGGQPSDEGTIVSPASVFRASAVRMDAVHDGRVLHFGRFEGPPFHVSDMVEQAIDVGKRLLHSSGFLPFLSILCCLGSQERISAPETQRNFLKWRI